jgi:hypothetical protein
MHQHIELVAEIELHRTHEVPRIPFAIAINRDIDRQNKGFEPRSLGAFNEGTGPLAVAIEVELHPEPAAGAAGDIFHRDRRDRAEPEGNAGAGRGHRHLHIPLMRQKAVEPGRSDEKRQRHVAAEQLDAKPPVRDIDQRARHQSDIVEDVAIAPQRHLLLGAPFDIFPGKIGHPAAGHLPQVLNRQGLRDIGALVAASFHLHSFKVSLHAVTHVHFSTRD